MAQVESHLSDRLGQQWVKEWSLLGKTHGNWTKAGGNKSIVIDCSMF